MGSEYNQMIVNSVNHKEVKDSFVAAQDDDLRDNGHSYSGGFGMATGLDIQFKTFNSADEASEYLQNTAEKWCDALAVQFKSKDGTTKTMIGAWCSC
jgi:hypothetical protein